MNPRMRMALVASSFLIVCSVGCAVGYWFWPSLHAYLPFQPSAALPHLSHQSAALPEDWVNDKDQATGFEQESNTEKAKPDKPIELFPAPDFRMPEARTNPTIIALQAILMAQTALSKGRPDAAAQLRNAMLDFSAVLAERGAEKLSRNEAQAIAIYALSGGDPLQLSHVLKTAAMEEREKTLLEAVLLHARSDMERAKAALAALDTADYGALLEAQINLALASLSDDSTDNIVKLSRAAHLVPGMLVEEAAIRRILAHLEKAPDLNKFLYWSGRYLRRFPNSSYRPDFDAAFMQVARALGQDWSNVEPDALARHVASLHPTEAAALSKILVRLAIERGDVTSCLSIRSNQSEITKTEREMQVLFSLCEVGLMTAEKLKDFQAVDTSTLSPDVASLLAKAITLAENILIPEPLYGTAFRGPVQPLLADLDFADIATSATQQLHASNDVIRKADGHANAVDHQP